MPVRPSVCLSHASRARPLRRPCESRRQRVIKPWRRLRADPILAVAAWVFRLAGQRSAAAASKRRHFWHKIVLCFVFLFYVLVPS